jgi:sterol desaturase/sphingolipid hydroxylase (fatty acid hydroxylase superfamily)
MPDYFRLETWAEPAIQLAIFFVVLGALQWCFPNRREQGFRRREWKTDLAFYWGQNLLWLGVQFAGLLALRALLRPVVPESLQSAFAGLPLWAQILVVVLLGDISTYWFHRMSHRWAFLWRFHRVHHSTPRLDWLAAFREHPVDGLLTQLVMNLPAIFLGFGLAPLAGLILFRGMWATFIHSNVRLPLPGLRLLVGAPELHHYHHLLTSETKHNFSNLAPWTDLLFGTYYCPEDQDFEVGLPGQAAQGYLQWIVRPGWEGEPAEAPARSEAAAAAAGELAAASSGELR